MLIFLAKSYVFEELLAYSTYGKQRNLFTGVIVSNKHISYSMVIFSTGWRIDLVHQNS